MNSTIFYKTTFYKHYSQIYCNIVITVINLKEYYLPTIIFISTLYSILYLNAVAVVFSVSNVICIVYLHVHCTILIGKY